MTEPKNSKGPGSDRDWMYNQSGVIPFRFEEGELRLLLITSRRKKHWGIPKGIVESHLSARDSAAQEAFEEAGVRGKVSSGSVGRFEYKKWGGTCRVEVFLLEVDEVLDEWPEGFFRERRWLSAAEAARLVDWEGLRRLLLRVSESLRTTTE
jgi:8-oxo-dGTP pyrophosphatase MutT (NUDIX family)